MKQNATISKTQISFIHQEIKSCIKILRIKLKNTVLAMAKHILALLDLTVCGKQFVQTSNTVFGEAFPIESAMLS
jgi:hypothetical protein